MHLTKDQAVSFAVAVVGLGPVASLRLFTQPTEFYYDYEVMITFFFLIGLFGVGWFLSAYRR